MAKSDEATKSPEGWAQRLIRRSVNASGDVTVQLSDLSVFMGYFAACVAVGGLAWLDGFNTYARFEVFAPGDFALGVQKFLQSLSQSLFWSLVFVAVFAGLAVLYFLARFVVRLWFGLLITFGSFCALLLVSAVLGNAFGQATAEKMLLATSTEQPQFMALGMKDEGLASGDYFFLHQSDTHVIVFKPTESEESQREIRVLSLRNLSNYRLDVK